MVITYFSSKCITRRVKKPLRHLSSFICYFPIMLIILWLVAVLPVYLPNMGGTGLKLPMNIVSWTMLAAITAITGIVLPAGSMACPGPTTRLILLGVCMLAVPLFYTRDPWLEVGLSRWAGLLAGVMFCISLMRYRPFFDYRRWVVAAIIFATALQAGIALCQLFAPQWIPAIFNYPISGHRPYGVFQQVNLLASFIATGLALTLMRFLVSEENKAKIGLKSGDLLSATLLMLFSLVLVLLQSRIGWLGGGITCLLLLVMGFPLAKKRVWLAATLIAAGIAWAIMLQVSGTVQPVAHTESNHARRIMLQETLSMIGQKPLSGWGYGGFEYSFQHFRAAHQLSTLGLGVVRHPHNEILLWWVEGGVPALLGLLVLIVAGATVFRRVWRKYNGTRGISQGRGFISLGLMASLLPILLHTQTEYPFISSTPHWMLFLILSALLGCHLNQGKRASCYARITGIAVKSIMVILSLAALVAFSFGLYGNFALTQFERSQFSAISPAERAMYYDRWVNQQRWHYDKQQHQLLLFNQTRDQKILDEYQHWAENYLLTRIDRNVYGTLVSILAFRQDEKFKQLREEADTLFPDDPRFQVKH